MKGLDISSYQRDIDFQEIKNQGYEFLILRGGYTGWGGTGNKKYKDTYFEYFYEVAKNLGFKIGVYHYSCANTYQKGVDEANWLYENCLKNKQFEFPVYIDVEDNHHQLNNKAGTTEAIIGFCETLENKGYYVGYYANLNWLNNHIDTSKLTEYDLWLAQWCTNPSQKYKYGMWQSSSSGKIKNITVDTDICYKDYTSIIKNKNLNGFNENKNSNINNEIQKPNIQDENKELYYTVVKNDNLTKIAKQFNTTVSELVRLNNISNPNLIFVGQKLLIHNTNENKELYYTVVKNDNLTKIAKQFNTTVSELVRLNNISNPNLIFVGQLLKIK